MGNVKEKHAVIRFENGEFQEKEDEVALEYALTIVINGDEFATMVCTPNDLEDLVVGFLASEGVIRRYQEIKQLTIDEERGFAYVELLQKDRIVKNTAKRWIGSCCGVSREFYFQSDVKTAKTVSSRKALLIERCLTFIDEMQHASNDFHSTGGLHNAALCSHEQMLVMRSDIGRHNALDKIYGHCLRESLPFREKVIAFSGRISSEVLLKVSKMGIGILLSKSAPTSLALKLAHDLGITAVGFIRQARCNIYTHPERIITLSREN
ncbi:formate dehydrogenase accessory protein [Fictibacillus macauensis ZFHKF-1]|uniref:Sulfur carrier protein FdhD n=1 Tax=Fictibacillus macauensis ZFHKF-1 TaxID=1196324 RepID=I8AH72_9BACL|nr:formate dehydrogenase accessory sulfurtransferase FdhD [Fictibacillus macauensis]EIT84779.1 formate dehydrogenase accessory protein [Fictibacillus macauensis ZFHKF-1]